MSFTQDFRTQRRNYTDGQTRIGETGRLWYDSESNTIRVGDGETEGGVVVGGGGDGGDYTLPTATTTVKGGVKVDGQTIVIDNQQISVGLINYSSISNPPTLLSDFTNDVGFITSSALSSYATQTYVTTRGYITSYTETDPVFLAHPANNVTNTKISNWDTAYSWGNHASAGYLTSVGTISYNDLSNKPTLFSGSYTDLTNKPTLFSGSYTDLTNKPTIPASTSDLTNGAGYITSSALSGYATETYVTTRGYITSYTETDPVFVASAAYNITSTQITNWDTAYGWGDHASAGYLTSIGTISYNDLTNTPTIPSDVSDLTDTGNLLGSGGSSVFSNQYSLTTTTSNATETELLVNGSTRIPVATNTSVNYIVNIAARRTDTPGDYAMFEIRGVAANSAGTVSDIGSVYELVVARTNAGYLVDVRADDTNNSVNIYVTGVSGHTVDWKAIVQTIEV